MNQSLKYTLGQVDKAGDVLARNSKSLSIDTAWKIIGEWRSSYHVPLHYLFINLSRHAKKIDKNVLLARRLKRAPAIFSKLQREPGMLLRRMQDVAGCRAIMPTLDKTIHLSNSFQKSSQNHELIRVKDYIKTPKESGYRGIHLIYKFKSNDSKNLHLNGRVVEIQIRSLNQHLWATAVEIVGMMTKQALKASSGSKNWLDFFKSVSEGFAYLDRKEKVPDLICRAITNRAKKLEVQRKLTAFTYAVETSEKTSANYYLLVVEGMQLNIMSFNDIEQAERAYASEERMLANANNRDVVLVGADSFHNLKRTYPNYFGDSQRFVKILDSLIIVRKKWYDFGVK